MILKLNEPVLNKPIEPYDFQNKNEARAVCNLLEEELKNHPDGIGLSANQIGVAMRVFMMRGFDVETATETYTPYFNPSVRFTSVPDILEEGCLSNPNLFVKIRRPSNIRVSFQNIDGESITKQFIGLSARCFLHELDHLDGINYLDRATKYHLDQGKKKLKKLNRMTKKAVMIKHPSDLQGLFK